MSKEEANKRAALDFAIQLGLDALGGMLSGLAFGTGSNVVSGRKASLIDTSALQTDINGGMITESGVVFPAQEQAAQRDAKSTENIEKASKPSEKASVQTPDETAADASATASENSQLVRYLTQEYGEDWAQTVTPEQLQKAKYLLGLAATDDPALNTPLYKNLTPDAVQELKREYGRRWWDKATEEDVLIVQQASLAGKDQEKPDVSGAKSNLTDEENNDRVTLLEIKEGSIFNQKVTNNELDLLFLFPNQLKKVAPDIVFYSLKESGYDPLPLGRGSLRGIPFEDGGGYRLHWGGDKILQFHPIAKSHHEGAYFKISSGQTGIIRIVLGKEE